MPRDLQELLEQLDIRDIDDEIFSMSRAELREHFCFGTGSLNATRLIKNLIWQDHQKIVAGELEPIFGNIRSYWYRRVKPVLARARARRFSSKYDMMTYQLKQMVADHRLFSYADFGFKDDGEHNRRIGGANRHIFCVAEKMGHMPLLEQLRRSHDVTAIALGGQPSALSTEYFLAELDKAGFELEPDQVVPFFTIVDYDPAGDSIARSFIWQMQAMGFAGRIERIDLIHPSRMTLEQVRLNRYPLPRGRSQRKKNQQWAGRTGGLRDYGGNELEGLEADAMTWEQIIGAFEELSIEFMSVSREEVIRRRLEEELFEVLRDLLLVRLGIS